MPRAEEVEFADRMGRYFARRNGWPPMVGRVWGYLTVCEPADQSINELAAALLASRSAITGAVGVLEQLQMIVRSRTAGQRMDRVRIDLYSARASGLDPAEYEELGALARAGLEIVADAPDDRKAALIEVAALADFLVERMPVWRSQWLERREQLHVEKPRTTAKAVARMDKRRTSAAKGRSATLR